MKPIATDHSIEDLAMFALSVHNLACRMPIAVKARDSRGILIEDGELVTSAAECNSLDCLFAGECLRQIRLGEGKHRGMTMFASAIVDPVGERVAAIGIIDTLGILSLEAFVADHEQVERQLKRDAHG